MPKITAITLQVKDKERVNLYLDGKFFCGLLLESVIKHKLKVGDDVLEEEISNIQYDSEKSKALDKAMGYLSLSMKTTRQVEKYLSGKGYNNPVIFFVLEKLKEYGYLDDSIYAVSYIRSYSKKKGKKLIEYELISKGIDKVDVEKAYKLIEESDETLPENPCKDIAEKYMKNKEITKENLQKLYRYLLGKGFTYEQAKEASFDNFSIGETYD